MIRHRLDGVHPDVIPVRIGMQQIRHNIRRQHLVLIEKFIINVEMHHLLIARSNGRQQRIDLFIQHAKRIVRACAAREDGMQNHLCVRNALAHLLHNQINRRRSDLCLILPVASVVGADHDDHQLRRNSVKLAVAQAPEHIFCFIGAEAQIQVLDSREHFLHQPCCGAVYKMSDRVADKDQIDLIAAIDDLGQLFLVAGMPPLILPLWSHRTRQIAKRSGHTQGSPGKQKFFQKRFHYKVLLLIRHRIITQRLADGRLHLLPPQLIARSTQVQQIDVIKIFVQRVIRVEKM